MVCWLIQEDPTYCIATKPRHLRAHALQLEATAMRSPHTTRESLHTAAKNQHSQKYIFFKKVFQVLIPHSIKKSSKRKEKFPTTKQWKSLVSHETQARRLQGPSIHGAPVVCVCVCVCVCVWPYTRHQVITISKGTDNLMFYARKCVFAKMYYGNLD